MAATENRDQTVASLYIGVKVDLADVDWALAMPRDDLISQAFEDAQEAVKRRLADSRFLVESDT